MNGIVLLKTLTVSERNEVTKTKEVVNKLRMDLIKFRVRRVNAQYAAITKLKEMLPLDAVQMDFAENCACNTEEEISGYFQRGFVTLHPMVMQRRQCLYFET